MNKQDELATLLNQQLSLCSTENIKCDSSEYHDAKIEQKINYSISQHYHHSAHTPLNSFTSTVEPMNEKFTVNFDLLERTLSPALCEEKEMVTTRTAFVNQVRQSNEAGHQSRDYNGILLMEDCLFTKPQLFGDPQDKIPNELQKKEFTTTVSNEDHDMDGDMIVDTIPLNRNNYWEEEPLSNLCSDDDVINGNFKKLAGSEFYIGNFFAGNQGYCYATDPVYNKTSIEFHY